MYVLGPVLRTVIGRRLLDKQAQQLTVSYSEDMYRDSTTVKDSVGAEQQMGGQSEG